MSQVFVSYAHKDGNFVAELKKQLANAGFEPMVDTDFLHPGEDWRHEIDAAIQGSFALIAVMSPTAFKSQYVTYEWAFALGLGIKVVPLMLVQTKLHPRLIPLQYIPFDDHFSLFQAWEKLLTRLKQIEGEYQASPKPKTVGNLPIQVQNAIDVLHNPNYFDTTDVEEISALHKAVNSLSPSKHLVAREALLAALEHANPETRRVTAWVLGESRDKDAVPQLIASMTDIDLHVRAEVIAALAHIHDERCVPELIKALSHRAWETRAAAAIALSNFPPNSSTSPLLHALNDKTGTVRAIAARSLGELGDARAISALKKCSTDKDKSVRESALEAVEKITASQTSSNVAKSQNDSKPTALKVTDLAKSDGVSGTLILPQVYPKLTQTIEDLLMETEEFILMLGNDVQFKQNIDYVAFKREPKNTNIVAILFRAKKILLIVKLKPDEIILEEDFIRVADSSFWGKDRFEIRLQSKADLEKAKALIVKSYELNG